MTDRMSEVVARLVDLQVDADRDGPSDPFRSRAIEALLARPELSDRDAARLAAVARHDRIGGADVLAGSDRTPAAEIVRLSQDDDRWARTAAAAAVVLPDTVAARLATDSDPDVRETLAANPRCPARLLACLAGDGRKQVRAAAAGNRSTPTDRVVGLLDDRTDTVRVTACDQLLTRAWHGDVDAASALLDADSAVAVGCQLPGNTLPDVPSPLRVAAALELCGYDATGVTGWTYRRGVTVRDLPAAITGR